jgi:hypothetical protein
VHRANRVHDHAMRTKSQHPASGSVSLIANAMDRVQQRFSNKPILGTANISAPGLREQCPICVNVTPWATGRYTSIRL